MLDDLLARLRSADLLRLVALDAGVRGLPRPFVEAIRAGVDALEYVSEIGRLDGSGGSGTSANHPMTTPRSLSTENG